MTEGWTVHIDATTTNEITDDETDELAEAVEQWGGALAIGPDPRRIGITMTVRPDGADVTFLEEAAAAGSRTFVGLLRDVGHACELVRLEALTFEEHDRDLAEPVIPELVGVAELAELLGVSTQRASELQNRAGFPEPVTVLRSGPVWVKANVERFASTWSRKPGRPPKVTA